MIVSHFFIGVALQVLGVYGFTWAIQQGIQRKPPLHFSRHQSWIISFGLAMIMESTLIGTLSIAHALPLFFCQFFFFSKVALGAWALSKVKFSQLAQTITKHWPIYLWGSVILFNACLPTSSFDNFSAHFPIPNLFIEAGGYPNRPDFQYLDALPLGAHMWFIPGFSVHLEGATNAISPIFSFALILGMASFYGRKLGHWALIVCLSMPEFIRVSLDPMMDTPCFFYGTVGFILMRQQVRIHQWIGLLSWMFLLSIKPTLLPLPILGTLWIFTAKKQGESLGRGMIYLVIVALPGALWYLKNGIVHQNPFYPYLFSQGVAPYCPPEYLPMLKTALWERVIDYAKVLFAEHRYNLSLGFWPLFCLPFIFLSKNLRRHKWLMAMLCLGLGLTFVMTPFKNRYAMPFILIALPLMALIAQRSSFIIKTMLVATTTLNVVSATPYLLQPLLAWHKNWTLDEYYDFKFYNHEAYTKANELPEGKILLIGQASHWIKRPHLLSVISETHLDYTRMTNIQIFKDYLLNNDIQFIVFDRADVEGMSNHPLSTYRKKSYCAKRALHWVNALLQEPQILLMENLHGVDLIDVRKLHQE